MFCKTKNPPIDTFFYLIELETGEGLSLSLSSMILTTWGTVFSVDSVKDAPMTAGTKAKKLGVHSRQKKGI